MQKLTFHAYYSIRIVRFLHLPSNTGSQDSFLSVLRSTSHKNWGTLRLRSFSSSISCLSVIMIIMIIYLINMFIYILHRQHHNQTPLVPCLEPLSAFGFLFYISVHFLTVCLILLLQNKNIELN